MPPFIRNPILSLRKTPINTTQITCRTYKGFYPDTTPSIFSLSQTDSMLRVYTVIYIQGVNFTPYSTTVTFGPISNIPIVFYNNSTISFVVPSNLFPNEYSVQVVTNATNRYNVVLLTSNKVSYTITK